MSAAPPAIVVAGAGRMGIGIAQTFAYAGLDVVLADLKERPAGGAERVLDAAAGEIAGNLAVLEQAGVLAAEDVEAIAARVTGVEAADAPAALAAARFVFEAAPELREAKRAVFARIAESAPVDAVIASTTSSFLVDALAGDVPSPERFLNTHWLNPAYLIPLVEVSPGAATSAAALAATEELLRSAGKVPVRCAPSPGYIVPRIQALAMNEAARLVEEGVASPEAIDTAARLGFGVRFAVLGLLEFIDWGGSDTLLRASEYLRGELGAERFAPPPSVLESGSAGKAAPTFRGLDGDDYRRETIVRFIALLRHLDLLPSPGAARAARG